MKIGDTVIVNDGSNHSGEYATIHCVDRNERNRWCVEFHRPNLGQVRRTYIPSIARFNLTPAIVTQVGMTPFDKMVRAYIRSELSC